MNLPLRSIAAAVIIGVAVAPAVEARKSQSVVDKVVDAYQSQHSFTVPAAGTVEVAFSPDEGSEHLVVKVIDSAKREIDVLSYSFSSLPVVEALVKARHRGVKVVLVADKKDNVSDKDTSGARASRAALGALVNSGADVRVISVYPIHHDKVVIVDGETVEIGSFNYSAAAAHRNSENVLVNWGNPKLAEVYETHFKRNYAQSVQYVEGY